MSYRRLAVPLVVSTLVVGACSQNEPPPPPEPPPTTQTPPPQPENTGPTQAELDAEARARLMRMQAEERNRLTAILSERVHFEYDKSELTPQAQETLRRKIPILQEHPTVRLRIEGHADERGTTEYNQALGSRRARAVQDFLANYGLSADRFAIVSFGEERPISRESNEAAWAQNRRAEFVITAGQDELGTHIGGNDPL